MKRVFCSFVSGLSLNNARLNKHDAILEELDD